MADSVLNMILRASKTGTGAADAKRELQELAREQANAQKAGIQATRATLDMAKSLSTNASAANVTQNALGRLNTHMQAGRITTEQYAQAAQAAMLQSKQISPASLQAANSINSLNSKYAQGNISAKEYAQGLTNIQGRLDASMPFMERYGQALKSIALVGLGALAAGFVDSIRTAGQFESAMNQITALTNTTKQEIGGMTDAVLAMSKTVGKGPKELAEGLYFIASSGFAGEKGLKVLEAAAKASAAGLGETKVVANALTSTLNAYKMGAEQAGRVTDVLVTIVKEGKGEPAAFAASFGRILPVAAAAGVSFEEVGASMATMTLTGMSAEESATSLRGTLSALEAPGKQATDALMSIGLSADEVRQSIRDKGLLATLQDLMERTHGNIETLDLIIPNIRALTGVLSTAGSQADAYSDILGRMSEANGTTEQAFKTASETMEFSLKQTEASFDGLKISLMQGVLPVLKSVFDTINNLIGSFNALPEGGKQAIETMALFAVGTAPAIMGINKVKEGITGLQKGFSTFNSMREAGDSVFKSLSALRGIEFGALAAGLIVIANFLEKVGEAASASTDQLVEMSHSGGFFEQAAASTEIMAHGQDRLKEALDGVRKELLAGDRTYADYRSSLEATAKAAGYQIDAQGNLTKVFNSGIAAGTQIVQTNYAVAESDYAAERALHAHGGLLESATKGLVDLGKQTEAYTVAQKAASESMEDGSTAAADIAAKNRELALSVASMTAGYGSAVSKEMKDYGAKQDELKTKAADLAKEISKLEAQQGRHVATSAKGTLSANEMAAAQAKLGAITEDLTNKTRKKNETDAEFGSRMANLQVQADKLTGKLGAGGMGTAIVDNSAKIAELKTKYDEATQAIDANAAAHDEAMKRIVLDIAQQQMATDGWTQTEITAFTQVAVQMGVSDQASANLTTNVLGATAALAQDGNIDAFGQRLSGALDAANNSATAATQNISNSVANMANATVAPSASAAMALAGIGTAAQGAANTVAQSLPPALASITNMGGAILPPVDTKPYEASMDAVGVKATTTGAQISATIPPMIATVSSDPNIPMISTNFNASMTGVQLAAMSTATQLNTTIPPTMATVANDPNIPMISTQFNASMTGVQLVAMSTATQLGMTLPPALLALANDPSPATFATAFGLNMSAVQTAAGESTTKARELKTAFDLLKSKEITITTRFVTIGQPPDEAGSSSGQSVGGSGLVGGMGVQSAARTTPTALLETTAPSQNGMSADDLRRLIVALEALAAQRAQPAGGNAYNLTMVNPSGGGNVLQDFAMLQALAGG